MEENESVLKETSKEQEVDAKNVEENVDLSSLEQIENILEKDSNNKLKFLDFERQMFLDSVYNDGLVICAIGISYDRVLLNILKVYVDPSNLIIVLNADEYEEKYFTNLLDSPHVHQAATNSNEREKTYLSGGIQFISTQVLVLDLLRNKIPAELITGIIVLRAHQIIESCQESFALRLYRQKNKTGFIKAFSSSCQAFTMGYNHVEKVMRNLFVRDLFLWPRFHALIQKSLKAYEPTSIEFHIPLSSKTTHIQTNILDIMNFIVKEIKKINPTTDFTEVTVENCMTKSFQKMLQSQLDMIWHQLSSKTKLLITDLKILRSLMFTAIYGDAVTFYAVLRKYRMTEYSLNNSGWTLLSPAEQLFKLSKERVFNNKDEFEPEPCPKWKILSEILRIEIPSDIKTLIKDERNEFDKEKPIRILVLCHDSRTCHQLNQYLTQGLERTLFWMAMRNDVSVQKLSDKYKNVTVGGSGTVKDLMNVNQIKNQPSTSEATPVNIPLRINEMKHRKRKSEINEQSKSNEEAVNGETFEDTDVCEPFKDTFILTMTQKTNGNESFADFDISLAENFEFEGVQDESLDGNLNVTNIVSRMDKPTIFIQTFRSDHNRMSSLSETLYELTPDYVILYNTNITAIRQIEMFEARLQRHPKRRLKVFVLMHAKTVEEQSFLTSLRREKQAFELLIETKRVMVVPEYQDGKSDILDPHRDCPIEEDEINTRQAGGQAVMKKREKPRIIVDSREFRSELPCLIHRRGLEVIPAMISIGDYILTPDICVERKSISDLIGSLNCGRLYNQCQQMTRFYSKAILLIEFDQNRPFNLQGRYMLSRDSDTMNAEIMQKLQLLTIHFPKLRLVWSPTPYSTAQLFEELKQNKDEPNLEQILQNGSDDPMQELAVVTDTYNSNAYDFLMKLPGINSKNIHGLMRKGKDFKNLMKLSEQEFTDILGSSKDAKLLHDSLHIVQKQVKKQDDQKSYKQKKFSRRN